MAIQHRRGTAADATAANVVLAVGQLGVETDTGRIKAGDGVAAWTALPYSDATAVHLTGAETITGIKTFGVAQIRAAGTNTALGQGSQAGMTTGNHNTAVGQNSHGAITSGIHNTAMGTSAQSALSTGIYNTAFGSLAQNALVSGNFNTGLGIQAQYVLTTGTYNTAVGMQAQYAPKALVANATTTALNQTCIGAETGQSSATQVDAITTVGYRAIAGATGAVALGASAEATHAGSVAIGYQTVSTGTDQVNIGPRDLECSVTGKSLVIKSPLGVRYRIAVSDAGTLSAVAA